jgi:hypothetical protein
MGDAQLNKARLVRRVAGQSLPLFVTTALVALTLSTNALAEDFIGLARDASQVWFLSKSGITKQQNGEIQTDVYQVFRDGRMMGGSAVHFADFRVAYDCAGQTWHPVKATFFGEGFSFVGSADLATALPKAVTPENVWGPAYACDPSTASADRLLSGKDWREVASTLYTRIHQP